MNRAVQNFLNDLTDFSNVALSSHYSYTEKPLKSHRESFENQQLDLNNHSRLLDQFRRLREKLRLQAKKSNDMKIQWQKSDKRYEDKIAKMESKQIESSSTLRYLKRQIETINEGIDQLKRRNIELEKQHLIKKEKEHEINQLNTEITLINQEKEQIILEKEKIKQIMIVEKLELERKNKELMTVTDLDNLHFKELEIDLMKSKQLNATLQYKLQHLEDQQRLLAKTKKEQSNSVKFREDQLESKNQQLKIQLQEYKRLYEEEKAKRKKNQNFGAKKQELASLYHLQNEAQERQIVQLKRRVEKLTDRYQIKSVQAECEAFKSMETLTKLLKSIEIAEEIIHRLKRDHSLPEDVDKLIKTSEYKLNKIKQSQNKRTESKKHMSSIPVSASKKKSNSRSHSRSRSRSKSPHHTTRRILFKDEDQTHSYSTPKLMEPIELSKTIAITDTKTIEDKVRREVKQRENQLRVQLEFQKYNRVKNSH